MERQAECVRVGFISSNTEVVQHFIMVEIVRLMGVFSGYRIISTCGTVLNIQN